MDNTKALTATTRRRFLGRAGAAAGAVALAGGGSLAGAGRPEPTPASPPLAPPPAADGPLPAWFPRQDPALVEEVVTVAHRDLAAVERLVSRQPELAKAQWDWGYGDWESPLDAASHVGQREIALLLLRHGARPTLFSAAMLGQLEVVEQFVLAAPGIQGTLGPHGIPLLKHAKVGGAPAAPVVDYLLALGGADGPTPVQLAEADTGRYLGSYRFGAGNADAFEVAVGRFGIALARSGGTARGLVFLGDDTFHPVGAPSVRVRFDMQAGAAAALAIWAPDLVVRAQRLSGAPSRAPHSGSAMKR
jgi:hypothetical protein